MPRGMPPARPERLEPPPRRFHRMQRTAGRRRRRISRRLHTLPDWRQRARLPALQSLRCLLARRPTARAAAGGPPVLEPQGRHQTARHRRWCWAQMLHHSRRWGRTAERCSLLPRRRPSQRQTALPRATLAVPRRARAQQAQRSRWCLSPAPLIPCKPTQRRQSSQSRPPWSLRQWRCRLPHQQWSLPQRLSPSSRPWQRTAAWRASAAMRLCTHRQLRAAARRQRRLTSSRRLLPQRPMRRPLLRC